MTRQQSLAARIGVDIGGTFTDVVLEKGEKRHTAKVLTTPRAPEEGVAAGLLQHALAPALRRAARLG